MPNLTARVEIVLNYEQAEIARLYGETVADEDWREYVENAVFEDLREYLQTAAISEFAKVEIKEA